MNSYYTLREGVQAEGTFVDRKSKFIAQLVYVDTQEEAQAHIAAVRAKHYDARHNVPAWILSSGEERQSDDGEPQRTSGIPTLTVLRAENLADVCVVVTRYFGGTLLGPGGLVRAYTAATQAAVEDARQKGYIVEMTSVVHVSLTVSYPLYDKVLRLATDSGAKVLDTQYSDTVTLKLVFKEGEQQPFVDALREIMNGQDIAHVSQPQFAEF